MAAIRKEHWLAFLGLVMAGLVVALILMVPKGEAVHRFMPNAVGIKDGDYRGVEADIEVANPQLRDCAYDHCFSMIRTLVQNLDGGHNWFGEIGWIRGWPCGGNPWDSPNGVVLKNDNDGWSFSCLAGLKVGSTHHFEVQRADPPYDTLWDFWMDGVVQDADFLDFSTTTRIHCGGETSSTANAMGVGACIWNVVRRIGDSYSEGVPWWYDYTIVDSPYVLVNLPSPNYSWQVYGNN